MKTKIFSILISLFFLTTVCFAQDPVTAAPNVYHKVLLDNDNVRVMEIEFDKGEVAATHSHPRHVVYVLEGGELTITGTDGKSEVMQAKPGDTFYMDATTHSAKNTGKTVVKAIVTELKK